MRRLILSRNVRSGGSLMGSGQVIRSSHVSLSQLRFAASRRVAVFIAFLFVENVLLQQTAFCADISYFVGPNNGSWHVDENWSVGHIPRAGDTVRMFDDLTAEIEQDVVDVWEIRLGYLRGGHLLQTEGHVSTNSIQLGRRGEENEYEGSYELTDGRVDATHLFIGQSVGAYAFTMTGGTLNVTNFDLGQADGHNTFTIGDGNLTVTGIFSIAADYYSLNEEKSGTFTQLGGMVKGIPGLALGGAESFRSGVYNLTGGELTLPKIGFGSGSNSHFDFQGGALNLLGDWTFSRLTGIDYSDFRVFGNPATEHVLDFSLVVIDDDAYTQIRAIPELSTRTLGDFNDDARLDVMDIDSLSEAVRTSSGGLAFDLNGDEIVDSEDRRVWVEDAFGTIFGDASLDKQVTFIDFTSLSFFFGQAGGWEQGDFDGNGFVQFADFLILSDNFGQSAANVATVPEPSGCLMIVLGVSVLSAGRCRRRWLVSTLPTVNGLPART